MSNNKNTNNKIYIDFVRTKALEKDEKKVLANKEVIVYPTMIQNKYYLYQDKKGKFYIFNSSNLKEDVSVEDLFLIKHGKDWVILSKYFKDAEITATGNLLSDKTFLISEIKVNSNSIIEKHYNEILNETNFKKNEIIYDGIFNEKNILNSIQKSFYFKNVNYDGFIIRSKEFIPEYKDKVTVKVNKIYKKKELN